MPAPMQDQQSTSATIPAPLGGWNARDPFAQMPPDDAILLENMFPDTAELKIRNGFQEHADTGLANAVNTLIPFTLADGTEKLVAIVYDGSGSDGEIWDVTTSTEVQIDNSEPVSNSKWDYIVANDTLLMVNGTDQPLKWTGTGTVAQNLFTGIADDAVLIQINSYRERLYLVEKDSQSVWYTDNVQVIAGGLTELDLSFVTKLGGHLLFTTTWTRDSGTTLDDMLVCVFSTGEVLIYAGSYPGSTSNWERVGQFVIPEPLGRRAYLHITGDLVIITKEGPIALSQMMATSAVVDYRTLTDKIDQAFTEVAEDYGDNFGWEALLYPIGHYTLFNIPVSEETTYEQYVMNNLTGAWTRYTGMNACAWCIFQGKPYFGGTNGKVYEADYGSQDDGATISWKIKTAFNFLGDNMHVKHFNMIRPIVRSVQPISMSLDIDVDFGSEPITDTISLTGSGGSPWNTSAWDTSDWDSDNEYTMDWYGVSGVGRCVSIKMQADYDNIFFALSAIHINYEPGGIL